MPPLALTLHPATARPRYGSCQALTTLMRRPLSCAVRVKRASCVLNSCVLCLAPPAVDLLGLLVVVCVLLLFPLSVFLGVRQAVAFSRWLHALSCSTWLIVRSCLAAAHVLAWALLLHLPSCVLRLLRRCSRYRARRYNTCFACRSKF